MWIAVLLLYVPIGDVGQTAQAMPQVYQSEAECRVQGPDAAALYMESLVARGFGAIEFRGFGCFFLTGSVAS